jgi:large subunit ribosomal protein L4
MPIADVYNMKNQVVGQVELDGRIFDAPEAEHIVHQVVRMQFAARRAGTACTRNRALVTGSRKKPYKQKGTGRARAGTRQSPLWRGGGVVFGPMPRDHGFKVNRKVRKAALRSVLSSKCRDGRLKVLDHVDLPEVRTKHMMEILRDLGLASVLLVTADRHEVVEKSARNIPAVKITPVEGLNVLDVLRYRDLVIVRDGLPKIERRAMAS